MARQASGYYGLMKAVALLLLSALALSAQTPIRVAIAGLVHGHVDGFFRLAKSHPELEIAGVFEPDQSLHEKYGKKYGFAPSIFYTDLNTMLDKVKPQAVAAFTDTFDHPMVVEAAAARKILVMMEKPMAVSVAHAKRIQAAVTKSGIPLIVNYETTWYASHQAIWKMVKEEHAGGAIRKMVAMDGHAGPKAIGVGQEFFRWLSNPEKNGAGALFDFGCYGANLMTWLMDGARPVSVTAVTQRYQPSVYPRVDDEANVLVEYSGAIGIIEGSWNWPYARKDFEVYTEKASAVATGGTVLTSQVAGQKQIVSTPPPMPANEKDSVAYLVSVVRGRKVEGLSSLANNMVVVEILDAARESARTGKRVLFDREVSK